MLEIQEFSALFKKIMGLNKLSELCDDDAIIKKFYALTNRMLEVNSYMNLTAITDIPEIILKHYVDSLMISNHLPHGASIIDIGCGAGFPSLPLAIVRDDLRITALDSTAKRVNYIKETAKMLSLCNINPVAARAEDYVKQDGNFEKYDFSCARAVARLNVLCELCMPYVKQGGAFLAMKANAADELTEARNAISVLGGELSAVDEFELTCEDDSASNPRCIITINKISHTPKIYPRNNSQIKKKPL